MSGFDGRIAFEGDTQRCKQLLGRAIKHANVQRQSKNILGQTSSIKTYDMGGGAYAIIADLSNMRSIHIVAPVIPEYLYEFEEELPGPLPSGPGVYDVLSGFTDDPQIKTITLVDPKTKKKRIVDVITHHKPTHRTEKRHKNEIRLQRLAVPENPIFADPNYSGPERWTEHAHTKPTNYSGSMREVIQLIQGLGKIMRPTAEENIKPPLEPPLPVPTGKNTITHEQSPMVSGFGLYGPNMGKFTPRVNFDYRVAQTHGVAIDKEGQWWLIEIGHRGVHAMLLYMDPVSQTIEGAKRYCAVSPELFDFIYKFAGIPLGLTFPTGELFEKFKRAGEVVQLISQEEMRVYNDKNAMSSDSGWTFNLSGSEAQNTCWEWGLDEIKRGFHYSIGINLQREDFMPWTTHRSELAAKFSTLYEKQKCRRMSDYDAQKILFTYKYSGAQEGYKEFDKLVVTPTLIASARIKMMKTGKLYHPAKYEFQPQIKFPEHTVGFLVSFDFSDSGDPSRFRPNTKCDTPMYVCYIDGAVHVISYAYDTAPGKATEADQENTRQDCQTTGKWEDISTSAGVKKVNGEFYSTQWDLREEMATGNSVVTTFTAEVAAKWPGYRQQHIFSTIFYAFTSVAVYVEGAQKRYPINASRGISVALPMGDRNAYYYVSQFRQPPADRVSYFAFIENYTAGRVDEWQIYHKYQAWVGAPSCPPSEWIDKAPLDCMAHKRCTALDEEACFQDYLHEGFWGNACPGGERFDFPPWEAPELPSGYEYHTDDDEGEIISSILFINDTTLGPIVASFKQDTYVEGASISAFWWQSSPGEMGVCTIKATNSCLGEDVTNLMDDMDGLLKHAGGPEYMWGMWNSCYTGVIE